MVLDHYSIEPKCKGGSQSDEKMWTFCKAWSRNIEIVYKSHGDQNILTRIYYPVPPMVSKQDSFELFNKPGDVYIYIIHTWQQLDNPDTPE